MNIEKLKYTVSVKSTIEEAWSVIEENRHRSVIILDDKKVVGTISDGDLRKAMLAKRLLITPISEVMNVNFTTITEDERENAQAIIHEKDIFLLPVVDNKLMLRDIIIR